MSLDAAESYGHLSLRSSSGGAAEMFHLERGSNAHSHIDRGVSTAILTSLYRLVSSGEGRGRHRKGFGEYNHQKESMERIDDNVQRFCIASDTDSVAETNDTNFAQHDNLFLHGNIGRDGCAEMLSGPSDISADLSDVGPEIGDRVHAAILIQKVFRGLHGRRAVTRVVLLNALHALIQGQAALRMELAEMTANMQAASARMSLNVE